MANNNKKSAGAVLDIVCNLTIVAAAIVLLVALCVNNNNVTAFNVLILVGCAVCALAANRRACPCDNGSLRKTQSSLARV